MKVNKLNTAAVLLLAGFSMNAFAATVDGQIDVSADITVSCTFDDSPATLDFGTVDLTVGATANTSLSITCSDSATVTATATGVNDGLVAPYSYAMDDGSANYVGYNLYTTNGFVTAWSDSAALSIPLSGGAATMNFWGNIGTDQVGYSGGTHLTDTVTVTVTY